MLSPAVAWRPSNSPPTAPPARRLHARLPVKLRIDGGVDDGGGGDDDDDTAALLNLLSTSSSLVGGQPTQAGTPPKSRGAEEEEGAQSRIDVVGLACIMHQCIP